MLWIQCPRGSVQSALGAVSSESDQRVRNLCTALSKVGGLEDVFFLRAGLAAEGLRLSVLEGRNGHQVRNRHRERSVCATANEVGSGPLDSLGHNSRFGDGIA